MRALFLAGLLLPLSLFSQDDHLLCKNLTAVRTMERIAVDGVLDEAIWATAPIGDEFVQSEPRPNEPALYDSKVQVVYDDVALYVGALLYDPHPDSVMMRLSGRDQIGITDWFGITLDPYQSGRNGFEFITTAAGVQFDAIVANEIEDENWNAVWESAARIVPEGWAVEMRIPYSAFRFPKSEEHVWSVQFLRLVGRTREKTFWNPIDPLKEGWLRQCGVLTGVNGVKAPLRSDALSVCVGLCAALSARRPGGERLEQHLQRRHGCESGTERRLHAGHDVDPRLRAGGERQRGAQPLAVRSAVQ